MHLLAAAVAVAGAMGFAAASERRRLPLSVAPAAMLWALAAALWPELDPTARTHPFDVAIWVFTVLLCLLAVAHTSRTRAQQVFPFAHKGTDPQAHR